MTTPTTTRTRRTYATTRQCDTLVSLYSEYNPLLAQDLDARGPADGTPRDQDFSDLVNGIRNATHTPADFAEYTRAQASDLIGNLISSIRKLKAQARERNAQPAPAPAALTPGLYAAGEDVYRVTLARTGNLYASRLEVTGTGAEASAEWIYEGARPLRTLTLTPLTKDAAAQYGRQTGICCRCAALLTDPASIERGMGPICADKF